MRVTAPPAGTDVAPPGTAVQPRLSAFDGAMVVVSLVIGIGIFRTPALVAREAGTLWLIVLAWMLGGAVSLAGALVFAEIGSRCPRAGGFYAIVARCWHPMAGFLVNWAQVLMQGVGAATVAVIGSEYLLRMAGGSGPAAAAGTSILAAALIGGLTLLNAAGVRAGARAQNALSLAKVALIVGLTAAGLGLVALPSPRPGTDESASSERPGGDDAVARNAVPSRGGAPASSTPEEPAGGPRGGASSTTPAGNAGLLAALVAVFYTYGGYQNTMNLAGDVTSPRRNMPRVVFGGMALVTLLYLAINAAYVRALGANGVAASPLVAADLARAALGPAGERLVSLAIFLSAAGFVNATILHMPRGYLAMARDGLLPAPLGQIDPRSQAQHAGLAFFAATALIPLLFLESFERLVAYIIFTDTISLALLASCIFVLRRRVEAGAKDSPGMDSPEGAARHDGVFLAPGYPWLPAAFLVVVIGVAGDILIRETTVAMAGLLVVAAGLPLYLFMRWSGRRTSSL